MLGLFCSPKLALLDIFAEIFPLMLQDYVYCRSTDIVFGELILVLSEICNQVISRVDTNTEYCSIQRLILITAYMYHMYI